MHDLLIRGGFVVDGTGAPGRVADVVVNDGLITAVIDADSGQDVGDASRVVDATGKLVTPGWVDIHTHYDGQASWDPYLTPSSWHGVTTVVMGNCGVGFAPAAPDRHEWLIELMEGVEDIPGTALTEGLTWDWESFEEYLDALDQRQFVIDIGAQVAHGPVCTARARRLPCDLGLTALLEQRPEGVPAACEGPDRQHPTEAQQE